MSDQAANNKRIAKNTIALYVRMIIVMFVTLYTTRIVLRVLGVNDYGLYNVIGGVVAVLGILNSSVTAATQRYLAYDLGQHDKNKIIKDFSACLNIYLGLSLAILLLAETVGLWFVNTQLNIPTDRIVAANYVYQFTIFCSIISLVQSSFNASIIAHERMDAFAWISIVEVLMKLLLAYAVLYISYDHLIVYSFLVFVTYVIIGACYTSFSIYHFPECRFKLFYDKQLYRSIISYSGWNLFGTSAGLLSNQGVNILLNIFFNTVVNAARGIAYQISGAIGQLFGNFFVAVRPQITKYYASGQIEEMHKLVINSSRFMFFLALLFAVPIYFELPYIVQLWLGQTPPYLLSFASLTIITCVLDSFSNPLMSAALVSENIRSYQIWVSFVNFCTFPLAYLCIRITNSPISVFILSIFISISANIVRAYYVQKIVDLKMVVYFKKVIIRLLLPTILSLVMPVIIVSNFTEGLLRLLLTFVLSMFVCCISFYFTGLNKSERLVINHYVSQKISRITQHS